ncbi:MAG: hypothetical protein JZD40_07345 [Sulfolobus sp.]|nr:hypothetical protein [Sulfolobus sp.]
MVILHYSRKINKLQVEVNQKSQQIANSLFTQWTQNYSTQLRQQIEASLRNEYNAMLQQWKLQMEDQIRKDAITKSINTLLGKIGEEFAPVFIG